MLTTLRLFGIYAGIFLISLQGRAQNAARQPSYTLLSAGTAGAKDYALNKTNTYSKADLHALTVSEKHYGSIDALSNALCSSGLSDLEKVRSIYFWTAKNISYDDSALVNNRFSSQYADSVFLNKKAVCEGFSNLFVELCKSANLDARVITGYVKDENYDQNKILTYPNHAWNAVKINNKWHLLDVTWASFNKTTPNEQERPEDFFRHKLESNFLIDPSAFILTHLPEDPFWQLLSKPVDPTSFFDGNLVIENVANVDVDRRIAEFDALDSLDREIAYCERMVANDWNKFKEYRLGIAYYFKAQQLYRKIGHFHGRPRARIVESIHFYYDKSLTELKKLTPVDFGYEYSKDFINNIQNRKELLSYN